MPPKPWETQQRPTVTPQEILSSSSSPPPFSSSPSDEAALNQASNLLNSSFPPNSSIPPSSSFPSYPSSYPSTSYPSSYGNNRYGSYGGGGGGYGGSSYGSYGGYGGSYGGYGRSMGGMGMGTGGGEGGMIENSLRFLDSFNFVVNSLSDVARNLETNADGLGRFWSSIFRLIFRMKNWMGDGYKGSKNFFVKLFEFLKKIVAENLGFLLFGSKELEKRKKILNFAIRLFFVIIIISFVFPLLKKGGGMEKAFEEIKL